MWFDPQETEDSPGYTDTDTVTDSAFAILAAVIVVLAFNIARAFWS